MVIKMKKLLLIYPHNFLDCNMGQNARTYEIMSYLHKQGFIIDLFAFTNFESSYENFDAQNSEGIVRDLYLYDWNERFDHNNQNIGHQNLIDWVTPSMIHKYKTVVRNGYDYIVSVYFYTAKLLDHTDYTVRKVGFVDDFLSVANYVQGHSDELGALLDAEIESAKIFEDLLFISFDEMLFFDKLLLGINKLFLPHLIQKNIQKDCVKDIDLLFLGHDNIYNIHGIQWFIDQVYPHLNKNIRIHIVGKVTAHLSCTHENVILSPFVKDKDGLYDRTKISMCPLKNGTGMKIKVLEAMSYSIPVVCTSRGVDGLPDKNLSGCLISDCPKTFAEYINKLYSDSSFYNKTSENIENYFNEYLSYDRHIKTLNEVFVPLPNTGRMLAVNKTDLLKEGGLRTKGFNKSSQSNLPLVSIITVVYNNAGKLERAILSVLDQSYPNIEYIVVDGGSTDGSVEIIEKYADKIDYYCSQQDKGIYDAMNKGIALSTGDYIGIVNSDDMMLKDGISDAVNELLSQNADFVAAQDYCVDENGEFVGTYAVSHLDERCLVARNPCNHGAMIISKDAYNKIGYYDTKFRYAADFKFQTQLCLDKRFVGCKLLKHIHYFEMAGVSVTQREASLLEVIDILLEFLPSANQKQIHTLVYFMHEHQWNDDVCAVLEGLLDSDIFNDLQKSFLIDEMKLYGYSGKYVQPPEISETTPVSSDTAITKRRITIKKLIKYILPYGIVNIIMNKRKNISN